MSSALVVPFNFQPASVAVKTASYTIPAGKYARVVVNLEGSGTFTIDGATALRGTQNSVLASSNLKSGTNSGETGVQLTSTSVTSATSAYSSTTDQKTVVAEYWVPTGTVIAGTGTWRAVVMEYNNIT